MKGIIFPSSKVSPCFHFENRGSLSCAVDQVGAEGGGCALPSCAPGFVCDQLERPVMDGYPDEQEHAGQREGQ